MILRAVKIATANRIRVIASLRNATILDVEGELRIMGHYHPEIVGDEALVRHADKIKTVFEMDGLYELGILLREGDLMVLRLLKDGGKELVRYDPVKGRAIEHLTIGLHPQRVLVVLRSRPRTIFSFPSWKSFLEWTKDDDGSRMSPDLTELPTPINDLVGNMDSFTALLHNGQVCSLLPRNPASTQPSSVPAMALPGTSKSTATSDSSTVEREVEEPDISALLSDTPSFSPARPSTASLQAAFVDIPRIKTITTHPSSKATGLVTADGIAYILGPKPKPNRDIPCLPSLSSIEAPQSINSLLSSDVKIASMAIGQFHAVILTSIGDCYSAGDGKAGQLGIGDRVFATRAEGGPGVEFHPHDEESDQYAEQWEKMELSSVENGKVKGVHAGAETTLLLVE